MERKKQIVEELFRRHPEVLLGEDEWEELEKQIEEEDAAAGKGKRTRSVYGRVKDFSQTSWGQELQHPDVMVPGTMRYKRFRRRFRIPGPLFRDCLMPLVRSRNVFKSKYQSQTPLEIKTLVALRILARGSCCDDIAELSGCGESSCNAYFHQFVNGMSATDVFDDFVRPPTGVKLAKVMDEYSRLGFPGAVGSIDCTHIFWDRCPQRDQNLARGKDKYPSVTFEVVVDHRGHIHSCTDAFLGTYHDAVVVVNDPYAKDIAGGRYRDVEYSLFTEKGELRTFRGGYLISDAGYTNCWIFVQPNHRAHDERSVYWSEHLESVRKDVERVFGILKRRFFFLSHRVQYHRGTTIGAAMKTCCVLHNMLLEYDEHCNDVDWEALDPLPELHFDEENLQQLLPVQPTPHLMRSGLAVIPHTSGASITEYELRAGRILEKALQEHFSFCFKRGYTVWPRGFTAEHRARFPQRADLLFSEWNCLYTAPSWYKARNAGGAYTTDIGNGLFSAIDLPAEQKLCRFQGVFITPEQKAARETAGQGGYILELYGGRLLDCYANAVKMQCLASKANSARSLRHSVSGDAAQYNARISAATNNPDGTVWLVTTNFVPKHTEIFLHYGPAYQFPGAVDDAL
jgi:hypothetical protein